MIEHWAAHIWWQFCYPRCIGNSVFHPRHVWKWHFRSLVPFSLLFECGSGECSEHRHFLFWRKNGFLPSPHALTTSAIAGHNGHNGPKALQERSSGYLPPFTSSSSHSCLPLCSRSQKSLRKLIRRPLAWKIESCSKQHQEGDQSVSTGKHHIQRGLVPAALWDKIPFQPICCTCSSGNLWLERVSKCLQTHLMWNSGGSWNWV